MEASLQLQCEVAQFITCFLIHRSNCENVAISFIPLPPSAFESCARMVKMQSMCRDDDDGCCRGFHVALAEPILAFWRKVPMCTLQLNFGKSVAGYCSI